MGHKHALDLCKKWLLSLKSKFLTEEMMFKFKFQRHLSSRSIAEVQGSSTIFYMSYYSSSARNCYSRNISVLNFKILLRIRWFRVRPALKFLALCYFHMRYIHLDPVEFMYIPTDTLKNCKMIQNWRSVISLLTTMYSK